MDTAEKIARSEDRQHPLFQTVTTAQQLGSIVKSVRDIMRKDKGLNGDLDQLAAKVEEARGLRRETVEEVEMLFKAAMRHAFQKPDQFLPAIIVQSSAH